MKSVYPSSNFTGFLVEWGYQTAMTILPRKGRLAGMPVMRRWGMRRFHLLARGNLPWGGLAKMGMTTPITRGASVGLGSGLLH